jgi:hypothetical protein
MGRGHGPPHRGHVRASSAAGGSSCHQWVSVLQLHAIHASCTHSNGSCHIVILGTVLAHAPDQVCSVSCCLLHIELIRSIKMHCSSQRGEGGLPTVAAVAAAAAQKDAARAAELQQVVTGRSQSRHAYVTLSAVRCTESDCKCIITAPASVCLEHLVHMALQEIDALHTEVHAAQQATGTAERSARGLQNELAATQQAAQVNAAAAICRCILQPHNGIW